MKKKILGIKMFVNGAKDKLAPCQGIAWSILETETKREFLPKNIHFPEQDKERFLVMDDYLKDYKNNIIYQINRCGDLKHAERLFKTLHKMYGKICGAVSKNGRFLIVSTFDSNETELRQKLAIEAMDWFLEKRNYEKHNNTK